MQLVVSLTCPRCGRFSELDNPDLIARMTAPGSPRYARCLACGYRCSRSDAGYRIYWRAAPDPQTTWQNNIGELY